MVFEGLVNVLNSVFDPVFNPLLQLPDWIAILIISFIVALVSTLAYKYFTDQNLMKRLKGELKELQKEVKALKEKPNEAMKVQKQMMETNMKYMTQSFKPMFITFIPLILLLGWLTANLAYDPILAGEEFSTTITIEDHLGEVATLLAPENIEILSSQNQTINSEEVTWKLKGEEGNYLLRYQVAGQESNMEVIIDDIEYGKKEQRGNDPIKMTSVGYKKNIVLSFLPFWNGYLATYIYFSLIFSIGLRKLLRVV